MKRMAIFTRAEIVVERGKARKPMTRIRVTFKTILMPIEAKLEMPIFSFFAFTPLPTSIASAYGRAQGEHQMNCAR
mgnify:CR=1 FL=1